MARDRKAEARLARALGDLRALARSVGADDCLAHLDAAERELRDNLALARDTTSGGRRPPPAASPVMLPGMTPPVAAPTHPPEHPAARMYLAHDAAPRVIDGKTLSQFQANILHWVENEHGDGIVGAVAGSGKTSTLVMCAKVIREEALFLAFNKRIAQELESRLAGTPMKAATLHSTGMRALSKRFGPMRLDDLKYRDLSDRMVPQVLPPGLRGDKQVERACSRTLEALANYARLTLTDPQDEGAMLALAETYSIDLPDGELSYDVDLRKAYLRAVVSILMAGEALACYEPARTIDYTDMVWLPAKRSDVTPQQVGFVLVDECFAGDTLVTLADGSGRPIQEIVERRDQVSVLSYDEQSGLVVKRKVTGWHRVSRRGRQLVRIGNMRATADHPVYTREAGYLDAAQCLRKDVHVLEVKREEAQGGGAAIEQGAIDHRWVAAWRRLHQSGEVEGRPGQRAGDTDAGPAAAGLSGVEVRAVAALGARPDRATEADSVGRHGEPLSHDVSSGVHARVGSAIPERWTAQADLGQGADVAESAGTGHLVYGRRDRRGVGCDDRRVCVPAGGYYGSRGEAERAWNGVAAGATGEGASPAVHRREHAGGVSADCGVYAPGAPVQAGADGVALLRGLWSPVWRTGEGATAGAGAADVQRFVCDDAEPSAQAPVSDGTDEWVYCLDVEETHCFFADALLVHNCQDLNRAQRLLSYKCRAPGGRMLFVGDSHQCQPAGTMVRLADGSQAPIEQLQRGDMVVSFDRHTASFVKNGEVTQVATRSYRGLLYTVAAGGRTSRCTESHKWLVRWTNRTDEAWATYVMRQGERFRVGQCRLCRAQPTAQGEPSFGVAQRARVERADAAWILKVHHSFAEALAYEQVVFWPPSTLTPCSRESIDQVYVQVASLVDLRDRAEQCLRDHGRQIEYPIYERRRDEGQQRQGRGRFFETQACNLLPGYMAVPIAPETVFFTSRLADWQPIEVTTEPHEGEVYSLNVERHHTYVADGLLTCNSIYGFAGADGDSFWTIQRELGATLMALSVCYRCPTSVVALAQQIVPEIEASPTAPAGTVGYVHERDLPSKLQAGDMVVCRLTAPLVTLCMQLIARRIPARVVGREIGTQITSVVKKVAELKGYEWETFAEHLGRYQEVQTLKLSGRKDGEAQIEKLVDRCEAVRACYESFTEAESAEHLCLLIEGLFAADLEKPPIVLSTVHRAKGLEEQRVFILRPEKLPLIWPKQTPEEAQQELNLQYVAVTRAMSELYFVETEERLAVEGGRDGRSAA